MERLGFGGTDIIPLERLTPDGLGPFADRFGLVGRSRAILDLGSRIGALARSPATVLVAGETGTGKELLSRALHRLGPRAAAPFVPHNFAAIPDSLVESEVFGHVRGAFTGAHAERAGLFELADRGTLFLDEIGDASPAVQSRLLRVLQEGEVRRLGDSRARRVDVRDRGHAPRSRGGGPGRALPGRPLLSPPRPDTPRPGPAGAS